MSSAIIKEVLKSGVCPECSGDIVTLYGESMTRFQCTRTDLHFKLEVWFKGGNKITAKLNDKDVPEDELNEIDW